MTELMHVVEIVGGARDGYRFEHNARYVAIGYAIHVPGFGASYLLIKKVDAGVAYAYLIRQESPTPAREWET